MLKKFENQREMKIDDIESCYPNVKFLVKNLNDLNEPKGILVALSEKMDSFKELCILKTNMENAGEDVCIFGTYDKEKISVQREYKEQ